jgi:hypothetical protein
MHNARTLVLINKEKYNSSVKVHFYLNTAPVFDAEFILFVEKGRPVSS